MIQAILSLSFYNQTITLEKTAFKITLRVFTAIGVIVSAIGIYRYWLKRKQEVLADSNQNTINTIISDR